jgi:hypothetical protein
MQPENLDMFSKIEVTVLGKVYPARYPREVLVHEKVFKDSYFVAIKKHSHPSRALHPRTPSTMD